MALIGFASGLGVILLCWLLARRSERRHFEQRMAMLQRKIERRKAKLAAESPACHTGNTERQE